MVVDLTRWRIAFFDRISARDDAADSARTIESFDVCKLPIRDDAHPRDLLVGESDPDDWDGVSDFFEVVWWAAYRDRDTGDLYRVRRASRP